MTDHQVRSTQEIMLEKPQLQMPKIVMQAFGMLMWGAAIVFLFVVKGDVQGLLGWLLLLIFIVGGLLVIPKITVSILDKAHDVFPWGKKNA